MLQMSGTAQDGDLKIFSMPEAPTKRARINEKPWVQRPTKTGTKRTLQTPHLGNLSRIPLNPETFKPFVMRNLRRTRPQECIRGRRSTLPFGLHSSFGEAAANARQASVGSFGRKTETSHKPQCPEPHGQQHPDPNDHISGL